MEFMTFAEWNEDVWEVWREVYEEAFGDKHAKVEKIIRNMFRKKMCAFHVAMEHSEVTAIALSGRLQGTRMLLIDYIAVRKKVQNKGIGRRMVDYLKNWALENQQYDSILIEVEAEDTPENRARIRFWQKCGFRLTDYIHDYKVVPEPYRAMYLKLVPNAVIPEKEEDFFLYLGKFHRECFQGA